LDIPTPHNPSIKQGKLGETDVWTSLALKSCIVPGSAYAATSEMSDRIDQSMDAFSSTDLVESGEINKVSDFELDFWEEKWVWLQQQLQQIEVVSDNIKISSKERIMLECAWRERLGQSAMIVFFPTY
jgi:hypothetical protein